MCVLKSTWRTPLISLAIVLLTVGSAQAANRLACERYTSEAMEAAREVRNLVCFYSTTDGRWSLDPRAHDLWCASRDDDEVEEERLTRSIWWSQCKWCRSYAQTAAHAQRQNVIHNCGFTGPRWASNENDHYMWCINLSDKAHIAEITNPETEARAHDIGNCVIAHGASRSH